MKQPSTEELGTINALACWELTRSRADKDSSCDADFLVRICRRTSELPIGPVSDIYLRQHLRRVCERRSIYKLWFRCHSWSQNTADSTATALQVRLLPFLTP
jgi:hypothetical protein